MPKTRLSTLVCCAVALILVSVAPAWAQGNAAGDAATAPEGLFVVDWIIIAIYALSTIGLGVYFGTKQRSTDEYFVGSGNMNPTLIGVSIFATLLSTISYLSMPGEAIGKGPMSLTGILAYPLIYLIVAYGLLPVYMKHRVTSAYELLELRLGVSIRLLGACMFLALRLVWMTLLVFLAAKALTVMMGVDPEWIPWVVLVTGLVSVIYTSLGGMRAVVVTDFMQTVLLFGDAVLVVITVSWAMGGFDWFPTSWQGHWDKQPISPFDIETLRFDPKTRITLFGTILAVTTWFVCTAGGDQTAVQRFMSVTDVRAARRAVAVQLSVAAIVGITLTLVGFALLGYFRVEGGDFAGGAALTDRADDLFPRYISFHLPVGVSGLVVAAMFAAAMSSIDSGVNSVTAVVMTDFLDRFGLKPTTEKRHVLVARLLAFGIGAVVVLGSTYMGYIPGNITGITNKTVNLLTAPIFALFFFALFVRRASTPAVWIGTLVSVGVAALIAFSGPLVYFLHTQFGVDPAGFNVEILTKVNPATGAEFKTCEDPVSFQYIGPVSLAVSLLIGWLASFIFPRRDYGKREA